MISVRGPNCIQGKLAPRKNSLAMFVFVNQCTKLNVRFHSGCIPPYVVLYHVNHMAVQMMSVAVEYVLLVPTLWIHVHTFNVRSDLIKMVGVGVLNHLHHFLTFSHLGNAYHTKAIVLFINLLFGCISYSDEIKRISDMQSICR
jgi:hypothetical protein